MSESAYQYWHLTGLSIMALKNPNEIESNLKDIIFTEEQITGYIKNRDNIIEIKNDQESLGFILLVDLKNYFSIHDLEAKNYFVKKIDQTEWKNMVESPFFQRRKPQLVSNENIVNDDDLEFFILKNGQKLGPYNKQIMLEMVEKKEILLTDMASFNGGQIWLKLFQIDGFNRRTFKESDQLPGMPKSEFLNQSGANIRIISETIDAISSLAFLGNLRRGKTIEREREIFYSDEMIKQVGSLSIYKWLLSASIVGIIYFVFNIKNHLSSNFWKEAPNSLGEQSELLAPVDDSTRQGENNSPAASQGVNNQNRSHAMQTRKMNPIRPASKKSFIDTKVLKDNVNEVPPSPPEDTNYYYDNASPMELDPVRSQISKENFDNPAGPEQAPDPVFEQETSN